MANVISDETMEYVGILAKLELSDAEKEAAKKDMESMLDYIDKLNELDTSNVEPMSHVFPVQNVFREDTWTVGVHIGRFRSNFIIQHALHVFFRSFFFRVRQFQLCKDSNIFHCLV